MVCPAWQTSVLNTFNESDWIEFGYETGCVDLITDHQRLLRSLRWGDDDYSSCIFYILEEIFRTNPDALSILLKKDTVKKWIQNNDSQTYDELYEDKKYIETFSPKKIFPKDVVNVALNGAENMITSGKPQNAIDRMHTDFHGYLKEICYKHRIVTSTAPSITELFKLVYTNILKINSHIKQPNKPFDIFRNISEEKILILIYMQ